MRRPLSSALAAGLVLGAGWVAVLAAHPAPRAASEQPDRVSLADRFGLAPGQITTIAGAPQLPSSMAPRDIALFGMSGVAVDQHSGTVYVADSVRHMIFRMDASGSKLEPFAGMQTAGFNGDGLPALKTKLHVPGDLAVHPKTGDVYFADTHNYRIRAVAKDGSRVWTVAGVGIKGVHPQKTPLEWPLIGPEGRRKAIVYSGDGGPANKAELNQPSGVGLDSEGNVYIADSSNHRVRVVNTGSAPLTVAGVTIAPGQIETIAGSGERGYSGDGGPALAAKMDTPRKVRITKNGDVLVVDMLNQALRRIDGKTGTIETVAKGKPLPGELPVEDLVYFSIDGIDVGPDGRVVYSDLQANAVYDLDLEKQVRTTIAGSGIAGRGLNGQQASEIRLHGAGAVAIAPGGEVYVVDVWNNLLWRLADGRMTIAAGGGPTGDGGPCAEASFSPLGPIAADPQGNLYIGDMYAHTVRRVWAETGVIERFAGTGAVGYSGDGGPPSRAQLITIINLSVVGDDIYLSDSQIPNVRRVVRDGPAERIERFAGRPFSLDFQIGDGGPAVDAAFGLPQSVVRHPETGEYYVSDSWLNYIRKIDHNGVITQFAGIIAKRGFSGDGGPAIKAQFNWPLAMVFDEHANLYVVDHFNHRIRVIDREGTIRTFAGDGVRGFRGEGVPASQIRLDHPMDMVRGRDGDLYVVDMGNHCIRKIEIEPPHIVTTVAGICGERGFSGDGGPARMAHLNVPRGLALGADNDLYITDSLNGRIRAVRLE